MATVPGLVGFTDHWCVSRCVCMCVCVRIVNSTYVWTACGRHWASSGFGSRSSSAADVAPWCQTGTAGQPVTPQPAAAGCFCPPYPSSDACSRWFRGTLSGWGRSARCCSDRFPLHSYLLCMTQWNLIPSLLQRPPDQRHSLLKCDAPERWVYTWGGKEHAGIVLFWSDFIHNSKQLLWNSKIFQANPEQEIQYIKSDKNLCIFQKTIVH